MNRPILGHTMMTSADCMNSLNLYIYRQKKKSKMGQVIGLIDPADWLTLGQLKKAVSWAKKQPDQARYMTGIKKESELFDYILGAYLPKTSETDTVTIQTEAVA